MLFIDLSPLLGKYHSIEEVFFLTVSKKDICRHFQATPCIALKVTRRYTGLHQSLISLNRMAMVITNL